MAKGGNISKSLCSFLNKSVPTAISSGIFFASLRLLLLNENETQKRKDNEKIFNFDIKKTILALQK
jgi:hypothetical protein